MSAGVQVTIDASKVLRSVRGGIDAMEVNTLLTRIGGRYMKWIDDNFRAGGTEGRWRPLAPNTIAGRRAGSSAVLQDTGRLRQSFEMTISGSEVTVGSDQKTAKWHHFGTGPYTIRPKGRFLKFRTTEGDVFAREVRHPGLPARPILPSQHTAEDLAKTIAEDHVQAGFDK